MALLATLTDNFSAGTVDTAKWDVFLSGSATITQSSGQLVLVSPTAQSGQLNSKSHIYTLVGSSASLQLVSAGTRVANSTFDFLLRTDTNNDLMYWDLTNTTLRAYWDNGILTQLATTTYSSTTHQWLRIRESGGTIFWDYSADASSWTNFATMSTSSLGAYSGVEADVTNIQNGTGTITMLVDNFNVFNASVAQVAATVTATGGTQSIATVNNSSITQVAATVTATGGTQAISAVQSVKITQVAATVTATGGVQGVLAGFNANIAQVGATVTVTGGTQGVASVSSASIAQVAATVTATGGTQGVATIRNVSIAQLFASVTATGGLQVVNAKVNTTITQVAATIIVTGGAVSVGITLGPPLKNLTSWSNNDVKLPGIWTNNDVKLLAQWVNNDIKLPGRWTNNAVKLPAQWSNNDVKTPTPWSAH